jgi:glycosyltransferase involved in cell wall biosynthesis
MAYAARLRIALLCESGEPGGAESMMLELGKDLRARGHEVLPIAPANGDPWLATQFRLSGFEPETFSVRAAADPVALARVTRVLQRHRVDVVHSHDYYAAVYGATAAWLLGKPHVITMHGTRYHVGRARRRFALRWSAMHSRALVGVSSATATELATELRLPRASVRVVYNGVTHRPGDRERVRRELNLPPDGLLILAVGSLFPVKGHIVLLKALAELAKGADAPRWKAAIAGSGREEAALRGFIGQRGLSDRVHLLGFRTDVPDLLAAADVYALPSLSEGTPLALLEAMFAGRAVVASRVGGIPELVGHHEEALLARPGDPSDLAESLMALLADAGLRARLAEAARRRAESRFTLERMTDEYERLYAGG